MIDKILDFLDNARRRKTLIWLGSGLIVLIIILSVAYSVFLSAKPQRSSILSGSVEYSKIIGDELFYFDLGEAEKANLRFTKMNLKNMTKELLSQDQFSFLRDVVWSNDGSALVYTTDTGTGKGVEGPWIYIFASNQRIKINSEGVLPFWNNGNNGVFYSRSEDSKNTLYYYNIKSSKETKISAYEGYVFAGSGFGDQDALIYTNNFDYTDGKILKVSVNAKKITDLIGGRYNTLGFKVSPNNKTIGMIKTDQQLNRPTLVLYDVEDKSEQNTSIDATNINGLAFSQDNNFAYYAQPLPVLDSYDPQEEIDPSGKTNLFVYDLRNKKPQILVSELDNNVYSLYVSSRSDKLYFKEERSIFKLTIPLKFRIK